MKRLYLILSIFIISALVLTSCAGSTDEVDAPNSEDEIVLTLDELAEFDGQDGNPAYIAVDGIIYDVTDSDMWADGEHNGFEAGKELTEEINNDSPHGASVLSRMPVVGSISE